MSTAPPTAGRPPIAIVGMGYVGLPLALCFAEAGQRVRAYDHDPTKIARLAAGASYLAHLPAARIAAARAAGTLLPTATVAELADCRAVLICVPTPVGEDLQPDTSFIEATCRAIAPGLRPGSLVVLESTTWPGTTEELVRPLLEAGSGLRLGAGLLLAYSPEREDPGRADWDTRHIPKLVAGCDAASAAAAEALYRQALTSVVPVATPRVAEAAKLTENLFRNVNIALVNELKTVYQAMGIDVWQVLEAAASKPFGYMPFWPGPGLGGHCIPVDPEYLAWAARRVGSDCRFVRLAGEVNRAMPAWVADRAAAVLGGRGATLAGARILLWGLTYKREVDDTRESPALYLWEELLRRGALVAYHDPFVAAVPPTRKHAALAGRPSEAPDGEHDLFIIVTDHAAFTAGAVLAHGVPVLDTRRCLPPEHPLVHQG